MNEMIAQPQRETSAAATAEQAKALVQARYTMAQYNPRDWDAVRQDLIKECSRPSFANNKSAYYKKPVGDGVEGLGIRFVEVAFRCMRNVMIDTIVVFDDEQKRILRVVATDLESNVPYSKDVTIVKQVERSRPMSDGTYISVRKNSSGKDVYTLPARDDEILDKEGVLISKAIRTLGLRLIPGDLQDEAVSTIKSIRKDAAAKDPDGERKRLVDTFQAIGISVEQLVEYLGHPLPETTPDEIVELRGLYGALKDGETTWRAVMESIRAKAEDTSKADELRASLRQKAQERKSKKKAKESTGQSSVESAPAQAAQQREPGSDDDRGDVPFT